jgi:hypothetical protein
VKELLSNVGSGGGAPAVGAPAATGAAPAAEAPAEEKKKEEEKEESDDDMVRVYSISSMLSRANTLFPIGLWSLRLIYRLFSLASSSPCISLRAVFPLTSHA